MIMVMNKMEYMNKYNLEPGDAPEMDCAKRIYVSDYDENSLVGAEYENGECWIYGARLDQKVENVGEILNWLERNI